MTIAPELTELATPVDELREMPGNPRQGDIDAIARSLTTFGQRKPIVATLEGVVVAGNHTLMAARKLGWTHLAVVKVDDDPVMAQAFALADNRTAELGHYDPVALAEMIQAVAASDAELLAAISYDANDLDDLLAAMEEQAPVVIEHTDPKTRYGGGEGEGSYVEPTFAERLETYSAKAVRSVILDYPLEQYDALVAACARVREHYGLETNAELFARLVGAEDAALT